MFWFLAGCAARKAPAPAVVAAPTAIPTATPIVVVAPPPTIAATATPNAESQARKAVIASEIARLKNASPERDFEAAWAAQNTKFIALHGAGWHVPGVPENRELALLNKYDAVPIEGMTDVMEFPEQGELGRLAMKYATRYNQLLLAKLDESNAAKKN